MEDMNINGLQQGLYQEAATSYKKGDFEKARLLYDKILATDAADAICYNNRGVISASQSAYNEAERYLQIAIDMDDNYKEAWNNLGNVAMSQCMYEQAIECYQTALEIDPEYENALYNYAIVQRKMKNYKGYFKSLKKAENKSLMKSFRGLNFFGRKRRG